MSNVLSKRGVDGYGPGKKIEALRVSSRVRPMEQDGLCLVPNCAAGQAELGEGVLAIPAGVRIIVLSIAASAVVAELPANLSNHLRREAHEREGGAWLFHPDDCCRAAGQKAVEMEKGEERDGEKGRRTGLQEIRLLTGFVLNWGRKGIGEEDGGRDVFWLCSVGSGTNLPRQSPKRCPVGWEGRNALRRVWFWEGSSYR